MTSSTTLPSRTSTVPQLRNHRTIGRCNTPAPSNPGARCGDEARLFPGGWFCPRHAPRPATIPAVAA